MLHVDYYSKVVEDIKLNGLKSKTKNELAEIREVLLTQHGIDLSQSSAAPYIQMVEDEITRREGSVKDWVMLLATVVAAIFAVIASWPVVQPWLQAWQRGGKDASSQSPQSNSTLPLPPSNK